MNKLRAHSGECPKCGRKFVAEKNKGLRGIKSHLAACGRDWAAHFWSKVKKTDGCWLYQGCVNTTGYGMVVWHGKKNQVAHRIAYELIKGPIPQGLLCLHKCDTPRCVNPDHIFLGTDGDNSTDKARKGRAGIKLTTEKARAIKSLLAKKVRHTDIAAQFGVTPAIISAINVGRIWRFA